MYYKVKVSNLCIIRSRLVILSLKTFLFITKSLRNTFRINIHQRRIEEINMVSVIGLCLPYSVTYLSFLENIYQQFFSNLSSYY